MVVSSTTTELGLDIFHCTSWVARSLRAVLTVLSILAGTHRARNSGLGASGTHLGNMLRRYLECKTKGWMNLKVTTHSWHVVKLGVSGLCRLDCRARCRNSNSFQLIRSPIRNLASRLVQLKEPTSTPVTSKRSSPLCGARFSTTRRTCAPEAATRFFPCSTGATKLVKTSQRLVPCRHSSA